MDPMRIGRGLGVLLGAFLIVGAAAQDADRGDVGGLRALAAAERKLDAEARATRGGAWQVLLTQDPHELAERMLRAALARLLATGGRRWLADLDDVLAIDVEIAALWQQRLGGAAAVTSRGTPSVALAVGAVLSPSPRLRQEAHPARRLAVAGMGDYGAWLDACRLAWFVVAEHCGRLAEAARQRANAMHVLVVARRHAATARALDDLALAARIYARW